MRISYSIDSLERKGNKNLERYQCNTCVLIGKHAFSLEHHLNKSEGWGKKRWEFGENLFWWEIWLTPLDLICVYCQGHL
jgi:uncharacterized C2H2 Zn-finger protein